LLGRHSRRRDEPPQRRVARQLRLQRGAHCVGMPGGPRKPPLLSCPCEYQFDQTFPGSCHMLVDRGSGDEDLRRPSKLDDTTDLIESLTFAKAENPRGERSEAGAVVLRIGLTWSTQRVTPSRSHAAPVLTSSASRS